MANLDEKSQAGPPAGERARTSLQASAESGGFATRSLWLRRMAMQPFVTGDEADLAALQQLLDDLTRDLAGAHRSRARQEIVAEHLAIAHVRTLLLQTLADERLAKRDVTGAAIVARTLAQAAREFVVLAAEHRASDARERGGVTVVAGQVGAMQVIAGGGR